GPAVAQDLAAAQTADVQVAVRSKDKAGRFNESAAGREHCHERTGGGVVLHDLVGPKTGNKHVAAVKYETSRPAQAATGGEDVHECAGRTVVAQYLVSPDAICVKIAVRAEGDSDHSAQSAARGKSAHGGAADAVVTQNGVVAVPGH